MLIVGERLDEATACFARFGFSLTPRGHHSVGTSNHLAIFGDDYFELLGHEPQNAERAAGAWTPVDGFAGVILRTADADAMAERLREMSIDMTDDGPRRLSRPVELPDGSMREARFSSVHLDPALTPAGLILICEHHTRDLVWQQRYQSHPNSVTGIAGMAVATTDPARSAGLLARIYDHATLRPVAGGLRLQSTHAWIDYLTPEAAATLYGSDIVLSSDGADRNVAVQFKTSSLDAAHAFVSKSDTPIWSQTPSGFIIPASAAFGVALAMSAGDG